MPLYEYRCRKCENVFEYIQSLSEGPKRKCEECGGRLEKLVSRAGFIFKGTGWYETDFKDKPKAGKPSESKDESASKPKDSSPKKASKKPAASKSTSSSGGDA